MAIVVTSKSKRGASKANRADQELITSSLKRFKITADAESECRRQGLDDLEFSIGTGQWDAAVKSNREIEGKPCLTVNRAPAFLRQYTGEERQHRPSMLVSPVGSGADTEVAEIHQGVLRHIEVASLADVVYDDSYDWMMRTGWCPWRVLPDYVSEMSFDQEPRIQKFDNPFCAYLSPVRKPDGTDPLWAHIIRDYAKEEYEAEFGKSNIAKLTFPTDEGAQAPGWITKDGFRVAEYWWIDLIAKELLQLDDGTVLLADQFKGDKGSIVGRRETIIRKVNCVKHDATRVLERYEYPGKYIPFPEVNGVRLNVNGKIYRAGMVRDYRDAQRIYDFMVTRAVEQVDLTSKDPLMVPRTPGNLADNEIYRKMNRANYSHIYFDVVDEQGRQVPIPQRAGREPAIQAIREIIQQADYDMKSVIGIYGPSLGEESGVAQESGFAILNRKEQSDQGSVTWHDNLNRAIVWQGKILLDLWPKLINKARVQRIINPDDSVKHAVVFNSQMATDQYQPQQAAQSMMNPDAGLDKAYDVGVGDYDIVLSTGPMYATARKEAFKALTYVIAENPQMLLPMVGDIWAKNADFPDAQILADRFKKMLPPQLQDSDPSDAEAQIAQKDAALAALSQQHNQLVQELNRASDTIRTKRLDLESRERIALLKNQTDILLQMMKDHTGANTAVLSSSLQAINARLVALNAQVPIEQEAGPAPADPELPNSVEPKVQPIVPAAPTPRVQPIG